MSNPLSALPVGRTALLALLASAALLTGLLAPLPQGLAADPVLPPPDGLSESSAAASCWEIKQNDPGSADGVYWLLTPAMTKAEQFYCDQTREGGGWVLVGRGREGWSTAYNGSGTPAQVRAAVDGTAAFSPKQLSGELIEQLNDDESIASLPDGIRLVRATDQQGNGRQEARFTHDQRRSRWTWMFDSNQPVVSYTFDGTTRSGNGATTTNFGTDNNLRRVRVTTGSTEGWAMGFGFGSGVRGSNSASSYLWSKDSSTGYARPFTQVFLRPQLMSEDLFTAIPDSGTPANTGEASADSFALPQPWGTAGLGAGPSSIEGSNEVSAFAESGGKVFVGGNFTSVQRTAGGSGAVGQHYLAAFERDSGEFVSGFRPTFDNQVKAIAAMPGGRIAVGGYFSTVNGESHRGLVVLDATTGEIDEAFTGSLINALGGGVPVVRSLDVQDGYLYAGGSFTHSTGGSVTSQVYTRNAARFAVSDGTPDGGWNPEFNGTVVSLDASDRGDRAYFAGFFSRSKNRESDKAAALSTSSEELYPWEVLFSNRDAGRSGYQQAVLESGDRVWLGGSEHSIMSYDRGSLDVLSSSIGQRGGDFQALASDGDVVYGGCHCFDNQYEGATKWPSIGNGWTESHHIYGAGAWSASTGERIPSFNGSFNTSRGAGAWALFVDSTGALWQGGDYSYSTREGYQRQWSGGFVRHQQLDTSAPTTPTSPNAQLSAEGVSLSWTGSSDDRGVTAYQVLMEDRVVATVEDTSTRLPVAPADTRYFVRAIDARGNASASTAVFTATGSTEEPEDPTSATLIETGSDWSYLYDGTDPAADWQERDFDSSSWSTGAAPLGWGQSTLGTTLTTSVSPKPLASFHRHEFEVEDASVIEELQLTTRADDGTVLYVNGTEVLRRNVDEGTVSAGTYANQAISAGSAVNNPVTVTVPGYLITTGTNTITASVHSNYRSTPSHSFELEATATLGTQPTEPEPEPEDPTSTTLIEAGSDWDYLYDGTNPAEGWQEPDFEDPDWTTAPAPLGWGQSTLGTTLSTTVTPKPLASFHRHEFEVEDASVIEELLLTTRADDGIVVHVNGTEVLRQNIDDGPVNAGTYANAAVSAGNALSNPVTATIPGYLFNTGTNVITVSVHSNYRSTPSHSFDLEATATLGTQPTPPAAARAAEDEHVPAADEPASEDEQSAVPDDAADGDLARETEDDDASSTKSTSESDDLPATVEEKTEPTKDETEQQEAKDETDSAQPAATDDSEASAAEAEENAPSDTSEADSEHIASIDPGPASRSLLLDDETVWSYSRSGDPVPEGWTDSGFDDESWETGQGAFGWGYPDIDISFDDEDSALPVASYYRHTVSVEDVDELTSLDLNARADDGIVIYLNGEEVARSNLEDGAVTATTLATEDITLSPGDDDQNLIVEIPGDVLEEGENTLAVEVHSHAHSATNHSFAITAEENRR